MSLFGKPDINKLAAKRKTKQIVKILENSKNIELRLEAAEALRKLQDRVAVDALIEALKEGEEILRTTSAKALASIGDSSAVKPLIGALIRGSVDLRVAASHALGSLKAHEALKHLLTNLKSNIPEIRLAAIEALGMIGDPNSVKLVSKFIWEEDDSARMVTITALESIGSPDAENAIKTVYKIGSSDVRNAASKALFNLGLIPDKDQVDNWIRAEEEEESVPFDIPGKLLDYIKGKGDLPAIPEIINKLNILLNDPESTLKDIAEVVRTDSVLTARVVHIANSSYYSRGQMQISNLQMAVSRLGISQIKRLVYSFSVMKQFENIGLIDRKIFWKHSFTAAQIAQAICKVLGKCRRETEEAYIAGLMHDIGIPVFVHIVPQAYESFLRMTVGDKSHDPEFSIYNEEMEAIGTSHAQIGAAYISYWWPVEDTIVNAVGNHHKSIDDPALGFLEKLVITADDFCHSRGIYNGVNVIRTDVPFEQDSLKILGFSDEQIGRFMESVDEEVEAAELILSLG